MKTIFIADYAFNPLRKTKIKRLLEKRDPQANVRFLLFDREDLTNYIWRKYTSPVPYKIRQWAKRLCYRLYPGASYVEVRHIRKAFKDCDQRMVVVPYFDYLDELAGVCSEYLHDLDGNRSLFIFNKQGELTEVDFSKPSLSYLEYHVTWNCNLNCKGCGHHCNLFKHPDEGDLTQFVSDMERLAELFRNITNFRLLGGEPLMNKELPAFIRETRRIFPDSSIEVVTNGLLIPRADAAVFQAMNETNALFSISCYPPTEEIKAEIVQICEKEKVRFHFSPLVRYFYRQKHRWQYFEPNDAFRKCKFKYCHSLQNGHISVCPPPIIQTEAGPYLPVGFRVSKGDTIDLYAPSTTSGYDILDRFHCSIPYCRYCGHAGEAFRWEGHYTKYIDWR